MIETFAWILPLFSALTWLGMLLGMLIHWLTIGRPIYPSMEDGQTIAYISDVGAYELKPLFIAGSATTVWTLNFGMAAERWLRHKGKLAPNTSNWQKFFDIMAIISAVIGGLGITLLSSFSTESYPTVHDDLLAVFIAGYIASAAFIITEYQRLGIKYRQHPVLRYSFWVKLAFALVELALAIPFGILESSSTSGNLLNDSAILEWTIAFFFTLYILTFVLDLAPALKSRHHHNDMTNTEMANAYAGEAYGNGAISDGTEESSAQYGHAAQPSSNF